MLQAAGYYFGLGFGVLEVARGIGSQLALGMAGGMETSVGDLAMGLSAPSIGQVAGVATSEAGGMNIAAGVIVAGLAIVVVGIATLLFKKGSVELNSEESVAK